MDVILSSPRGFCAGVVRSIDIVDICLRKFGAPVYVKHQIVHNPHVVADLERKGAITVETVEEIPPGSVVVFSAHGSPPEDFEKAQQRGLKVIDAVCPLVTRVHNEAKKYRREGKKVILVGHRRLGMERISGDDTRVGDDKHVAVEGKPERIDPVRDLRRFKQFHTRRQLCPHEAVWHQGSEDGAQKDAGHPQGFARENRVERAGAIPGT